MINLEKVKERNFMLKCVSLNFTIIVVCTFFWSCCLPFGITKAKHLYFDPKSCSIYYDRQGKGMTHLSIILVSRDSDKKVASFDHAFKSPSSKMNLANFDTAQMKKYNVMIWIWESYRLDYDYSIDIRPENWNKKKRVYGYWNAR